MSVNRAISGSAAVASLGLVSPGRQLYFSLKKTGDHFLVIAVVTRRQLHNSHLATSCCPVLFGVWCNGRVWWDVKPYSINQSTSVVCKLSHNFSNLIFTPSPPDSVTRGGPPTLVTPLFGWMPAAVAINMYMLYMIHAEQPRRPRRRTEWETSLLFTCRFIRSGLYLSDFHWGIRVSPGDYSDYRGYGGCQIGTVE